MAEKSVLYQAKKDMASSEEVLYKYKLKKILQARLKARLKISSG